MRLQRRKTRDQQLEHILGTDAQYIHLGIELGRRVTTHVKELDTDQIDAELSRNIKDLDQQERRRQLSALFDKLPETHRYELLERHLGSDELTDILAAKRQREIERESRTNAVNNLKDMAQLHHSVDLTAIPEDMQVRIGLFEGHRLKRMRSPGELEGEYSYPRVLTLTSLGDAAFKLMNDNRDYTSGKPTPKFSKFQTMKLGTMEKSGDPETFSQVLPFGQPLACDINGSLSVIRREYTDSTMNEYAGLVSVQGVQLFGQNLV